MRTWENAEIVDLDIEMTAYGKNEHAREANANKHPNNGAGGSLNIDVTPLPNPGNDAVTPDDDPTDSLS